MGGGAWPFLVGRLPCQVDSGNERDLHLLTNFWNIHFGVHEIKSCLEKRLAIIKAEEVEGNNRSVMPLDVLGSTRVTMIHSKRQLYAKVLRNLKICIVIGIDLWNF